MYQAHAAVPPPGKAVCVWKPKSQFVLSAPLVPETPETKQGQWTFWSFEITPNLSETAGILSRGRDMSG